MQTGVWSFLPACGQVAVLGGWAAGWAGWAAVRVGAAWIAAQGRNDIDTRFAIDSGAIDAGFLWAGASFGLKVGRTGLR